MDSLTQIVLGASVAEAVAGKKMGNKALLIGAICGTIPDLDIFLPHENFIAFYENHRGFSHSILFAFLAAPLLAFVFEKIFKKRKYGFFLWLQLCFWSIITHPILDCFTSFGTQIFAPFSDYRVAFNTISVIDPLYTIPFLILTVIVLFYKRTHPKRRRINYAGLVISSAYLFFTTVTKFYVASIFKQRLAQENIDCQWYSTRPTLMNAFLWRFVGETKDEIKVGYYSVFGDREDIKILSYKKNEALLKREIRDDYNFKRIKKIMNHHYFIYKKEGTLRIKNLKMDAFFGWEELGDYEGSYILIKKTKQKYQFESKRSPLRKKEIKPLLHILYKKVFDI